MSDTQEKYSTAVVVAAFAAIYLIWGSTYLAIRFAVETIPPFFMAGTRFVLAGVPLYLFLRARGVQRPTLQHWLSTLLLGTLMLAGGNGLVTWAELTAPSGVAALIITTVPIWMTLLEIWPFRRASFTWNGSIGLICGMAGVAFLLAPSGGEFGSVTPAAGLALLVAAFSWSVGSLLARNLTLPRSIFMLAAMQMTGGGAVLLVWGFAAGEWSQLQPEAVTLSSLMALLYLITLGSIVAYVAYAFLLRAKPASMVSTYAFVNPVVAVVLGATLGNESVGLRELAGAVLIVGAVIVLQWPALANARRRRGMKPKPDLTVAPAPQTVLASGSAAASVVAAPVVPADPRACRNDH